MKEAFKREPKPISLDGLTALFIKRVARGLPICDEMYESPAYDGRIFLFKEDEREVILLNREIRELRSSLELERYSRVVEKYAGSIQEPPNL